MHVIGYVFEGDIYCEECLAVADGPDPNDPAVGAVFEIEEADAPQHCGGCRAFLGGALTTEGFAGVRSRCLEGWLRDPELLDLYMNYYRGWDWYFIPTPSGTMNPRGEFKDR